MTISEETLKKDLVEYLLISAAIGPAGKHCGVGYYIKKLNKKDKEICKKLTSKDFNHRIEWK